MVERRLGCQIGCQDRVGSTDSQPLQLQDRACKCDSNSFLSLLIAASLANTLRLDQTGVGATPCLTIDLWLPLVSGCKRRVPKGLLVQGAHGATCSHLQDP